MQRRTAVAYHPDILLHISGMSHPESPDRLASVAKRLKESFKRHELDWLDIKPAPRTLVEKNHSDVHIKSIDTFSEICSFKQIDQDTLACASSGNAAYLAVGSIIGAIDFVMNHTSANAFCAVRPPGHHAEFDHAMGFCFFNTVAIGAHYAIEKHTLNRVAIIDWDVHHGNGTQEIFWTDGRALTISIHQENCFPPASGATSEIGAVQGVGTNLNIPLPAGCGEAAYLAAFDQVVLPALEKYNPQLIIVPCGFDAGFHDPLGRMMLTSQSFRQLAARITSAAKALCGGKLIMTHEGGYSPHSVPFHCLAVLEELSGIQTEVKDPYFQPAMQKSDTLLPHQAEAISLAENVVKEYIL